MRLRGRVDEQLRRGIRIRIRFGRINFVRRRFWRRNVVVVVVVVVKPSVVNVVVVVLDAVTTTFILAFLDDADVDFCKRPRGEQLIRLWRKQRKHDKLS